MAETVEPRPEKVPLATGTTVALGFAFTSFLIPIVPAAVAAIVALTTKRRLRQSGGERTNEGLCTLALITSAFTLAIWGGYFLWTALTYG